MLKTLSPSNQKPTVRSTYNNLLTLEMSQSTGAQIDLRFYIYNLYRRGANLLRCAVGIFYNAFRHLCCVSKK